MPMQCAICKKTVSFGRQISRRGKAKYLGGVGRKITGITPRKYKPNLQRVRAVVDGKAVRIRVCVACLRSGHVQRRVVRKPFSLPT